jgi:nicotinate-nucleotide adenylyltransferase
MSLSGKIETKYALGVFGGTFDPPHIGHLILAAEAQYQLGLQKILWVLTPHPPHKQDLMITAVDERFAMLNVMLAEDSSFEISRVDMEREPPHYAFETMHILHQKYPKADLVYLMGADSLFDLPTWCQSKSFVEACDSIGVMSRPGRVVDLNLLESKLPGLSSRIRFLKTPLLQISSSQLRQRIMENQPFRYFVTSSVYQLIVQHDLYR